MEERKISVDVAHAKLLDFIRDCDADTLVAMYEYAFAHVNDAHYVDGEDMITYNDANA